MDETKTHQTISIRFPIDVYRRLKESAEHDERSVNYKVVALVKKCLDQEQPKKNVG